MNKQKTIVLVGGGTGGHIYPLIALAEELERRAIPFVYIGSANSQEQEAIRKSDWRFIAISSGKIRRYLSSTAVMNNFIDLFRVVIGFVQAIIVLLKIRPSSVLSKGGYVALPVVYAAKLLGIRVVIHESDAVIGLTNRLSKPIADKILTMFAPEIYPKSNRRFLQVGIPIRRSLRQAARLKSPQKTRPILMILPGSQGSRAINALIRPILLDLLRIADLVHMTGESDYREFLAARESFPLKQKNHYKVFSFIDRELPYYYQSSDLIICRASATVIAEAALFARALYLIPLPSSASDHQRKNAEILRAANAAAVGLESELDSHKLLEQATALLLDKETASNLGNNLQKYCRSDETIDLMIKEIIDEEKT